MKRITIATAVSLILAGITFPLQASAADGNGVCSIAQGNGSAATPWLVATEADFKEIGENDCGANMNTTQNYRLTANISLTSAWVPVDLRSNFPLSLNGDGYTVSGLNFSGGPSESGLFRSIQRGTVKDLRITGSSISGTTFLGALAGSVSNSTIRNVSVTMSGGVTGTQQVGGVIGKATSSSLSNLIFIGGTVTGTDYSGGVVGALEDSAASKLAIKGNTNFSGIGGGVIGQISGSSNIVLDQLWANGDIRADQFVGGLVGYIFAYSGPITVSLSNSGVRGFIQAQTNYTPAMFIGQVGNNVSSVSYSANYSAAPIYKNAATSIVNPGTVAAHNGSVPAVSDGNFLHNTHGLTPVTGHATLLATNNWVILPPPWMFELVDDLDSPREPAVMPWVVDLLGVWNNGYPIPNFAYNEGLYGALVPSAPGITGVAGDAKVTFTLTPTPYTGGERVTGYRLSRTNFSTNFGRAVIGDTYQHEATGLTNGQSYTFTFQAQNASGGYGLATTVTITAGIPCQVGEFSQTGYGACTQAPAGRFVAGTGATVALQCPAGTYQNQPGQAACIPAQPGFFVANAGSIAQDPCVAGTTSLATSATFCTPIAAAGYSGPMITTSGVSVRAGSTVNLLGAELSSVTGASIDGVPAVIVSKSNASITLRVPEISAGAKDLILSSGSGTLTVQGALRIVSGNELTTQTDAVSIKRIGNRVRLFATDVVGAGKIQFKINGKEVGWVRAVDETNPKLRNANGRAYFVRLAGLASGKNAVEIYVDGTRVKRVAYTR